MLDPAPHFSVNAGLLQMIAQLLHDPGNVAFPVGAAVASGTLLFVANAGELLANRAFVVKVALLMFAGLNAAAFHASAAKEALRTTDAPGPGMRAAGAASLLLWASVIVAGRLIAYV